MFENPPGGRDKVRTSSEDVRESAWWSGQSSNIFRRCSRIRLVVGTKFEHLPKMFENPSGGRDKVRTSSEDVRESAWWSGQSSKIIRDKVRTSCPKMFEKSAWWSGQS